MSHAKQEWGRTQSFIPAPLLDVELELQRFEVSDENEVTTGFETQLT